MKNMMKTKVYGLREKKKEIKKKKQKVRNRMEI